MEKKSLLTLIAALITTFSAANAQTVGLSYLGMCHATWPCEESLTPFDGLDTIRLGWLENTFGAACPCVDTMLKDPRPKEVRVHIANGTCFPERGRRCGRYEVFAGESIWSAERKIIKKDKKILERFKRVARRLRRRLAGAENLTCYVSPVLESDFNEKARRVLHRITASILPSCRRVDSVHLRACLPGVICEVHGDKPQLTAPCFADLDGVDMEATSIGDFLEGTKQCIQSHLWAFEMNCLDVYPRTFIDPRKRVCVYPSGLHETFVNWLNRK